MTCSDAIETAISSMQSRTHDLLLAIARRSGESDPAIADAARALEKATTHAEALVGVEQSAWIQERYEEAHGAAQAVLAAATASRPDARDPDRRSCRRDTQPQSPRALRGAMPSATFSTGPEMAPGKATNR